LGASHDFAVIGAGIAGASVAWELQAHGSVILLEREPLPGQHTTGRSAAFLVESYGATTVRRLTRASRGFLDSPPEGFAAHPLLHPNPVLWIGRDDQRASLHAALEAGVATGAAIHEIAPREAHALCPVLRDDYVAAALVEPGAAHIDVAGLHEAYLAGLRRRGGVLATRAGVTRLARVGGAWEIEAGGEVHSAPVVVNAAGAWCDQVARLAGARPVGLRPLRRTAITFDPPVGADVGSWPCVLDADEAFYFKPEGVQLLASPCDETPMEPCDAAAEDYEVALATERVQRATTLEIRHARRSWAGLRSFVADRCPLIGMDPELPGFCWLAGQGGFGIMTSPAAARAAAGLIVKGALPPELEAFGLRAEALSPARLGVADRTITGRRNQARPTRGTKHHQNANCSANSSSCGGADGTRSRVSDDKPSE
jgi:D-arginine dehydrogenase